MGVGGRGGGAEKTPVPSYPFHPVVNRAVGVFDVGFEEEGGAVHDSA